MPGERVWFFGYGSLMWHPGFLHDALEAARLDGWHRALCIRSIHYRGTPGRPGLVLGLAQGGSCVGRAIGVAAERETEVLAYLDARELIGAHVYDRVSLPVTLLASGRRVPAWTYVAKADHPDYQPDLDEPVVLDRVRHGHGLAGANADYVRNTVAHLRAMGIAEPGLERLVLALAAAGEP
jgi:cation transport protein ChaC